MSRKGKKVQVEKVETPSEAVDAILEKLPEPEPVKDEFDEIFPDDTDEVSLDDAARVLDVSVPVAKLWLLHGHIGFLDMPHQTTCSSIYDLRSETLALRASQRLGRLLSASKRG